MAKFLKKWWWALLAGVAIVATVGFGIYRLGQARGPIREVEITKEVPIEVTKLVEKPVVETVEVEKEVVVEKEVEVTVEVEKEVVKEILVTPTPGPGGIVSTAYAAGAGGCAKHGTIAWQNDNLASGAVYGEAPVGGLSEPCGVVAQAWTTQGGAERFVFYVPPYTVAWLSGHRGGTGWYFDPNQDVAADLQRQANELEARDGPMPTTFAILPDQTFRLITRVQTAQPPAPTATPTATPAPSAGNCNIGGESVGPAILEGDVGGVPTTIKLNAGSVYSLAAGGCWTLDSQTALDERWPTHRDEFLAKYPNGQAIEK